VIVPLEISIALGLAAGVLSLGLAAIVFAAAPDRRSNRFLAFALVNESVALGGARLALLTGGPVTGILGFITPFAVGMLPFIYLIVLSVLHTPLVRWIRRPRVRVALLAVGVAVGALSSVAVASSGPSPIDLAPTMGFPAWASTSVLMVYATIALGSLFGLVAAIDALRRAPRGSVHRRRAEAFAISFGVRDSLGTVGLALVTLGGIQGGPLIGFEQHPYVMVGEGLARLGAIIALPLLAYGITRTQLFDIDLRIYWGVRRGTVVTVFLVTFFIVAKVAETYLEQTAGLFAGAISAGLLLFATPRLNKLSERVAETAMPGVTPSAEYIAFRKLEVYKAAVESAVETGPIDSRERQLLAHLRTKLGLSHGAAGSIEADVMAARG
jgi:hypothetical protein